MVSGLDKQRLHGTSLTTNILSRTISSSDNTNYKELKGFTDKLQDINSSIHQQSTQLTSSDHCSEDWSLLNAYTLFTQSSKHQAVIKQTSSKRRAIRAHIMHMYYECICWMFAR